MPITGPVYALDLAVRTGLAVGPPGALPWSASLVLKRPDQQKDVAYSNLIAFLSEQWTAAPPALVVKEAMLHLQAFLKLGNSEDVPKMHAGLHAIVEGLCVRFGIPWRDVSDSTVRKHFVGKGRLGDRASTKAAVVARCHLLGMLPKGCRDDNRADALATWDYACATFARGSVSTERLFLFGERAEA
jgi:hypothetical protein